MWLSTVLFVKSVTNIFGSALFRTPSFVTADLETITISGKKRRSSRKPSGMLEPGNKARFSSRKRIMFALDSVSGCAERDIADLLAIVTEIPLETSTFVIDKQYRCQTNKFAAR